MAPGELSRGEMAGRTVQALAKHGLNKWPLGVYISATLHKCGNVPHNSCDVYTELLCLSLKPAGGHWKLEKAAENVGAPVVKSHHCPWLAAAFGKRCHRQDCDFGVGLADDMKSKCSAAPIGKPRRLVVTL